MRKGKSREFRKVDGGDHKNVPYATRFSKEMGDPPQDPPYSYKLGSNDSVPFKFGFVDELKFEIVGADVLDGPIPSR